MSEDTHERWIRSLRKTWPEGVPAQDLQPWPDTQRGGGVKQCLHCAHYVELEGALGSDWGACSNAASQYDRQVVFEHWTCKEFEPDD